MNANVGTIDRAARIIVGGLLMYLAYAGTVGQWGWLGAIFLVTGLISFCPLYRIVGIRTCKATDAEE